MVQEDSRVVDENSPRYYGWVVLGAAIVGMMFSSGPMLFGSIGLFVPHLEQSFGWTRSEIMLSLTLNTIATVISAPICGRLIDRFGVRMILIPSIVIFAVIWSVIPLFTGQLIFFYFIIFALGMFTVGTQSISYIRVISAWFDKKRGLAIGFTASGLGLSYMLTPLIVQKIFEYTSWANAYWIMALIILFISFPLMFFTIKNSPQKLVKEKVLDSTAVKKMAKPDQRDFGLNCKEALKVREFWVVAFAIMLFSLVLTGLVPHVVPIMTERGVDMKSAALMASIMGLATFVGRIGVGFLVDRIFAPYVAIMFFACAASGLLMLSTGVVGPMAYLAAVLIGLGFGAESDLIGYFVSRYFGLKAFGEIYGYIYGAFLIGAGAGPLLLGVGYDALGGYMTLLKIFGITSAVGCLLFLLLRAFPEFNKNESVGRDVDGVDTENLPDVITVKK